MDGKGSRRLSPENDRPRPRNVVEFGKKYAKFLILHRQILFAGILLTGMVVLLFGVFSRFQVPAFNTSPGGTTAVDYSTFKEQIRAGNVLAVSIQNNEVNGLLVHAYQQGHTATNSQTNIDAKQRSLDFTAWSHYLGGSSTWASAPVTNTIDQSRLIFTRIPSGGDAALMPLLLSKNVIVTTLPVAQTPVWMSLVLRFMPMILLVLLLAMFLIPRNGKRSTRDIDAHFSLMGKSQPRRYGMKNEREPLRSPEKMAGNARPVTTAKTTPHPPKPVEPAVTFADVAGIDEVRQELEEIVQFLRDPQRFDRLGARIPRGALLVGPPGTGKTLLAKAVASEAGVPFFSMSSSEFVEMFVGVGASRVRDLFAKARQAAPCVVFLDELDAVGRKRSMRVAGNDERDQTLNQLLVELDGFNARQSVVVMAATNRVDILDKALLRPGRFDRQITVSLPDRAGRQAILAIHTRRTPLHEEVSLERLARLTTGMSGADLANLVNEAALCAARQDLEHVTDECFEDALARVQLGALRPIVMHEREKRIIAFHEGGHALVAYHLQEADTVNRVTILPRGQSLGVTQFTAEEDRYNYSRETLMARIAVGLGGRVAEELTFGPDRVTTGAENDLQVVTNLARRMVTRWGMSEEVGVIFTDYRADAGGAGLNMRRVELDEMQTGPRSLIMDVDGNVLLNGGDVPERQQYMFAMAAPDANRSTSTSMASLIDREVQRILREGYEMARDLLREHYDQLTKLADALMTQEQLDRKQFEALLA
ncbi:MAG TPA: ATP-dependent zinc metalloprotease FtsH [Ktedonobacteraceae bacterium]|nr:ATP-dependent zinc metalloprotease FtsH [Ktedonobacteraceae bacterium]